VGSTNYESENLTCEVEFLLTMILPEAFIMIYDEFGNLIYVRKIEYTVQKIQI